MPAASQWFEQLLARWNTTGVRARRGNSLEDIRDFEERHGLFLPADLAEYFLAVDGMEQGCWDEHLIRFWPLQEVRPVLSELPEADPVAHDGFYVFADWSIWAHGYAIRLKGGSSNDVAIVGGEVARVVTTSFADFVEKYLRQPDALW